MKSFQHINCSSVQEAVDLLEQHGDRARPMAGGTDLLGVLKDDIHSEYPELVVNLKTIPGLDFIEENDRELRIGAATKLHDIARHMLILEKYTAVAEAARSVATPQIRRMATLGGNLCQEPRCWYYRHPGNFFHCLRKGGMICGALVGENRYHSIMGAIRVRETPCSASCPAATDIPGYLEAIRGGEMEIAARTLLEANPIPAVTGRVCPHFCQQGCNRDGIDQSVSIREIERTLGDYILNHGEEFYIPPEKETGKHIAIVGSGPGGLAAAYFLRKAGHAVTVFERQAKAGGMLTYSVPAYRLPAEIVERTIGWLEKMGIVFCCGVEIGREIPAEQLSHDFNAVFLATGAWERPNIGIHGEDQTIYGLDFLKRIREGLREAPGKQVVVIGGGDVAVDVAMSARRLGAEEVTMICLETPDEMPTQEWELDQALEESVHVMNSWGPKRVITHEGKITGVELVRCISVFDEKGRFAPKYDTDFTKTIQADTVLMAVGQRPDLKYLPDGVTLESGRVLADALTGETRLKGVYVGGDMLRPASVIDAVSAGRRAAESIHRSLTGAAYRQPTPDVRFKTFDSESQAMQQAAVLERRPVVQRFIDREDMDSLPFSRMKKEAQRCFNCGCVAVSPSDIGPALVALDAVIQTTRRAIPASEFFACRVKNSTVLEAGELVTEVRIPKPRAGSRSAYRKFRQRQSIDFPVVSAAVRLDLVNGIVKEARIVLGAAAPIPLQAKAAEAYLIGKGTEEIKAPEKQETRPVPALPGSLVAGLALQGSAPLAENVYKTLVTRAYVRWAVLACLEKK